MFGRLWAILTRLWEMLAGAAVVVLGGLGALIVLGYAILGIVVIPISSLVTFLQTPGADFSWVQRTLSVGGLLFVSFLLTGVRYTYRIGYGLAELAFALFVSWKTLTGFSSDAFSNAIALVGAVYLMVRGMSNVFDGLTLTNGSARQSAVNVRK